MASNPRIEDLRRRLEKEPGSRLFAQLAEELRKAGELDEAISLSLDGLQKHPTYPSARMTLGRCLLDKGELAGARQEFAAVVKSAPDNILAGRFLAECLEGLGDLQAAAEQYRAVLRLAPGDGQVAQRLAAVEARLLGPPPPLAEESAQPAARESVAEAAEPAPIPLASVEGEEFELERPHEAPSAPHREERQPAAVPLEQASMVASEAFAFGELALAPDALPVPEVLPQDPAVAASGAAGADAPWAFAAAASVTPSATGGPGVRRLEGEPSPPWVEPGAPRAPEPSAASPEIVSSTLAELYFSQGVTEKAIEVYRQVLLREPDNERARARLMELERPREQAVAAHGSGDDDPREARRAAIQRTIVRLEAMLTAVRKD